MPQHSPETHVTFDDFKVGIADSRIEDLDQDLSRLGFRYGYVFNNQFVLEKPVSLP